MRQGDALVVIEGDYTGYTGEFVDLTKDGLVIVEFGGKWRASFHPQDLELAEGFTLWTLLASPTRWWKNLIPSRED